MFYMDSSQMEPTLRFGDIIQGFPVCFSVIDDPQARSDFNITISASPYAVVLSPCCSISDKLLAIAPLQQLDNKLFNNPYLAENPARINSKVPADKSFPPQATIPPDKLASIMAKGDAYVFVDKFVYEPNQLLPEYTIHKKGGNITTGHYVIDFRTSNRISCDRILNPKYVAGACKVLQLTVETREIMRLKISSFYKRMPDEDAAILAS